MKYLNWAKEHKVASAFIAGASLSSILAVLKLAGTVSWPWLVVAIPLGIPTALCAAFILFIILGLLTGGFGDNPFR